MNNSTCMHTQQRTYFPLVNYTKMSRCFAEARNAQDLDGILRPGINVSCYNFTSSPKLLKIHNYDYLNNTK